MTKLLSLFLLLSCTTYAQQANWMKKTSSQWPQIALINEVWYANGDRYVHSSFEYAATGFVIKTETDTFAVTAKHVLWIAKTKSLTTVHINDKLARWIMHPKGNDQDSVVIDQLINEDPEELLNGPESSITQRDWLVFSTQYVSPNVQVLRPRFTPLEKGEKVWFFSCPYPNQNCGQHNAEVLAVWGDKIIFSKPEGAQVAGASGSAIVDKDGLLVGILGGSSVAPKTGKSALYGTSTAYLQQILENQKPYNTALIPINKILKPIISDQGIRAGVKKWRNLQKTPTNYFTYDFSPELLNALGKEYAEKGDYQTALQLYKASSKTLPLSSTYTLLGQAYTKLNNTKLAIKAYETALELWSDNEEAQKGLKALKKR